MVSARLFSAYISRAKQAAGDGALRACGTRLAPTEPGGEIRTLGFEVSPFQQKYPVQKNRVFLLKQVMGIEKRYHPETPVKSMERRGSRHLYTPFIPLDHYHLLQSKYKTLQPSNPVYLSNSHSQ